MLVSFLLSHVDSWQIQSPRHHINRPFLFAVNGTELIYPLHGALESLGYDLKTLNWVKISLPYLSVMKTQGCHFGRV